MQLKSLEIHGFKSFANKERFVFDEGITGIVGPNGCGKSNIVDAMRWVLGEQKTRNLRTDKMGSVIFNGTKDRRKSSFAEVCLTFDNTKNLLPTEYTSVAITRKLYRSGESEYQINSVTCRLKDIQNLFMDTGISSDSYAIIELKMVDEILTNKNSERKKFFEEAAGISKYKIRKKQTLKRLQDTDADLERVQDLLFEIEKNLLKLERQADRTKKYFDLKEEYRLTSSRFALLKVQDIQNQQSELEKQAIFIDDKLTELKAESAQAEARLQQLKKEVVDTEKTLAQAQQALNDHITKIQSVETDKSIKNERLKYLQQRELAIRKQLETEKNNLDANRKAVAEISIQREKLQTQLKTYEEEEARLKAQCDALRIQNEEQQKLAEVLSEKHRAAESEVRDTQREMEINTVKTKSLEAEFERTAEDQSKRKEDLTAFSDKKTELEKSSKKLEKEIATLKDKKEKHEEKLKDTIAFQAELKDAVYRANRILDAKQNEYNLTKSLVENLEGFPESVKFLKKNAVWIKDAPLVSDIFSVPDTYKVAFENYLEPYLSYYVVPAREDAILSVHLLAKSAKGRANFLILDELEEYKSSNPLLFTQAQSALELVDFADEYKKLAHFLLNNVYLVPAESEIPDTIEEGMVFLSQQGDLTRRKFMLGGGSLGLFQGKRLGRAKNLEKLGKEIKKLTQELTKQKVKLDKANESLVALRKINYALELEPKQKELYEVQRDLSVLQSREQEHLEFLERVGSRSEEVTKELENLRATYKELEPKLEIGQADLEKFSIELTGQKHKVQKISEDLRDKNQTYNEANIALIRLQNDDSMLKRELDQKQERIDAYDTIFEKLRTEQGDTTTGIDDIIGANLQDDSVIVQLYEEKKEKEKWVDRLEQQLANIKNSIVQVEEKLNAHRRKRENYSEEKEELKEEVTEVKLQLNSLQERMSVEFQIELEKLDKDTFFEEKPMEKYKIDKVEKKLMKLRDKVLHFGDINPLAVEAFEEMQERNGFIIEQRNDLEEARQTLLDTIEEIDETAEEKLLATFELIRGHFQDVYKKLFTEDSTSDLILKDPDNPLDSDIGIIAKPKGKRPQSISQLSGGEKTLTAVALLFAIYLIKPAPFCIFDEVDAPLDDANIDKFNKIIREFSKMSQFIIVTHNKRTMAATNVIYGITMEELGVSRSVPIDLETIYGNNE